MKYEIIPTTDYSKFQKIFNIKKELRVINDKYLIPMYVIDESNRLSDESYEYEKRLWYQRKVLQRPQNKINEFMEFIEEIAQEKSNIVLPEKKTNFELFMDYVVEEKSKELKKHIELYYRIRDRLESIFGIQNPFQDEIVHQLINTRQVVFKNTFDLKRGLRYIFNNPILNNLKNLGIVYIK